jgi:uncharacterized protein (DUF433 family)
LVDLDRGVAYVKATNISVADVLKIIENNSSFGEVLSIHPEIPLDNLKFTIQYCIQLLNREVDLAYKINSIGLGIDLFDLFSPNHKFNKNYIQTMGMEPIYHTLTYKERKVTLSNWIVSADSRFKVMKSMFFRNSNAIILVFDICSYQQFEKIDAILTEILQIKQDIHIHLIGKNTGMNQERAVSYSEAEQKSSEFGGTYTEISNNDDIDLILNSIVKNIFEAS